jgi:hypothetical protein
MQAGTQGLRHLWSAADDGLVASIARTLPRGASVRFLAFLAGALTVFSVSLATLSTPAYAHVEEVLTKTGGPEIKVGLQPRSTVLRDGVGTEPKRFANSSGAPVLSSNKTYAIYWDPTDNYHGDWQALIDTFFHSMGSASGSLASVFAVDAQYTDAANQHAAYASTFQGAYTDTDPYPTVGKCTDPHPLEGINDPWEEPDAITCITSTQIEEELKLFVIDHGLQKGMGTIFYLLTPPGVTVCLDEVGDHCSDYEGLSGETSYGNSFCSYHGVVNPDSAPNGDSNTIIYATVPWIAGGFGDGHLAPIDRTGGYECQDGGFDPSSKPIEEKEHKKPHTKKEEEEFSKETPQETREREEAEALELEKPHQQEPNQVPCPSPDGTCDTGLADLIVNQIAVEQQNIVTDPLLDSWKDPSGNEATDECRDFFAPVLGGSVTAHPETFAGTLFNQILAGDNYYLNDAFNLASLKLPYPGIPCLPGIRLEPKFTAPNPINSGEVVGFDGMESDITLDEGTVYTGTTPKETYAKYAWNFGDGTPTVTGFAPGAPSLNSPETSPCPTWLTPCAASTFHSYRYGGTYTVTLTVTDTGGNTASVTEPITVDGPPPPPPTPPAGGGSSATSTGPTGSSSGGGSPATSPGATTKPPVPGPVATQTVLSSSLSKTLSKGLVVRYSVSQQATGHFEVLLAASTAHRVGLHPPLATGLPAGTPPQVVIAKALLITTKAGRNTLKIQFGKVTAKRLRRLHNVPLLLRLNLRNAGGGTTTVLSKLTLH